MLQYPHSVSEALDKAYSLMDEGDVKRSVQYFYLCRKLMISLLPQNVLERDINIFSSSLFEHSRRHREDLLQHATPNAGSVLYVLSDSLALPRLEDLPTTEKNWYLTSYPGRMLYKLNQERQWTGGGKLNLYAKRHATSEDIVNFLLNDINEIEENPHFFIHIGLNDSTVRTFMLAEMRAAMLLPKDINKKIVEFANKYRSIITIDSPNYTYVPIDKFAYNLTTIAAIAKKFKCASLTYCTKIDVPEDYKARYPAQARQTSRYNTVINEIAHMSGANVIDIDRLVIANGGYHKHVDMSGHLSKEGQILLTNAYFEILSRYNKGSRPSA